MNATEAAPVEIVGQVIDNSHGGSSFTGDWLAVIALLCWPVTIMLVGLALLFSSLWDKIKSRNRTVEVPTVEHTGNPHAQRAERYEAEGNVAMAEHIRKLYGI